MRRRILLLVVFSISLAGHSQAQRNARTVTTAIGTPDTGADNLYYTNPQEPPRAIEFKKGTVTAAQFLAGIHRYLGVPADFTFAEAESNTDKLGMRHHLLQQYYKGMAVEGMDYRVHERDGFAVSANGKAVRNMALNTHTTLSEEQAYRLAIQQLQAGDPTPQPGRKLIVSKGFTFAPESFAVAFQFDVDVSLVERWRVSIDARTGELINKVSLVNTCGHEEPPAPPYLLGTGLTNYNGNQSIRIEQTASGTRLVGQTAHGGLLGTYDHRNQSVTPLLYGFPASVSDVTSTSTSYTGSTRLKAAVSVQWAAEQAFEYYFQRHGRNSFDNRGGKITSYVHVDVGLDNAFWNGKLLAFGDGSRYNTLVELDVVSHELTHGVTQYEAALQYANEPGALNESFSDIMAKAVEFHSLGATATWQMGAHLTGGGLRDFSNPNIKNQPDTYQGDLWYSGTGDNGGVHYNSGVQNFWFYLLCNGGSGVNDHDSAYAVNAIGMDAAVNISYRNLTEYLGPLSDYLDSRLGSMLATADLYGKNSTTYREVDKAWDAVGVIDEPTVTSLEAYDITATTAKIRGALIPRGDTVRYYFEYGKTPALGGTSSEYTYTDKVQGIVTGLQPSTKYYVRMVVTNEHGRSYSTVTNFTTIAPAPLVKILETLDVTETTATLYGQVNPNSLPTSFYFEYGPTTALGMTTPVYPAGDTTEFINVSAGVTGLTPRTTYYYRMVALNGHSTATTGSVRFFTAAKPVVSAFAPVTAPIGATVTITGRNFNTIPGNTQVSFGATRAEILTAGATQLEVKVPAGASLGPIAVLDLQSGLATESVREFVPTFTGSFSTGNLQLAVGFNDLSMYRPIVQDLDGDHRPDIIGGTSQGFRIFQNVHQGGDITPASFLRTTTTVSDFTSIYLYVADLDGNGLADVVGEYQNGLRIYPNRSVPGYIFLGEPLDVPIGNFYHLALRDFDGDGRIDIAYTHYAAGSYRLTVLRNQNPTGSLVAENFRPLYSMPLPYEPYTIATPDLNNDGAPELLLGSTDQSVLWMLRNDSRPGTLAFSQIITTDPARGRFARYTASDLNADGWKDVVLYTSNLEGKVAVWENKGTTPPITLAPPVPYWTTMPKMTSNRATSTATASRTSWSAPTNASSGYCETKAPPAVPFQIRPLNNWAPGARRSASPKPSSKDWPSTTSTATAGRKSLIPWPTTTVRTTAISSKSGRTIRIPAWIPRW